MVAIKQTENIWDTTSRILDLYVLPIICVCMEAILGLSSLYCDGTDGTQGSALQGVQNY